MINLFHKPLCSMLMHHIIKLCKVLKHSCFREYLHRLLSGNPFMMLILFNGKRHIHRY